VPCCCLRLLLHSLSSSSSSLLQTKGVKSIVSIEPEDAAMWAAVGGAGACVLSCLIIWPLMRSAVRRYDSAHDNENPKVAANSAEALPAGKDARPTHVPEDR
jgi:hypothetical protein